MRKHLLMLLPLIGLNYCFAQHLPYPAVTAKPVTNEYYKNYKVTDDYRWMEDPNAPELKKWIDEENTLTNKFISRASAKNNTAQRINEIGYVSYHSPVKKGKYYFTYAYSDEVSAPVLYVQSRLYGDGRIIVDPNFIPGKGKIVIKDYEVSRDSKYLAYEFGRNGSDWAEINITAIEGSNLNDHLTQVKFSDIAWQGDGFYYSKYPANNNLERVEGQTVYYHKLHTPQSEDILIFKRTDPSIQFDFLTTSDERYFILEEENKKAGFFNYFFMDNKEANPALKPLLTRLKFGVNIIDSHNDKLIATNFQNADNGNIIEIDPQKPLTWGAITPSYPQALLMEILPLNNKIMAVYQSGMHPGLVAMDYDGKILHTQNFPIGTSIKKLNALPDDTELLYSYQSYTKPPVVYSMNIGSYERHIATQTKVSYDYENYVYKESEYKTNDSVKVPIMLIYKKDIKLDGTNPTLLEAYGGFGAVNKPGFGPGLIYFLSKGGVYAYACIRGGGELGKKWAEGGKGNNKQNSFSDFIAGAEYLIKEGYTSPAKLAISGASNGGLVVAAAAMQRPELFKAVIPRVAPLDMLRFENFTVGSLHTAEYGTVKDSTGFTRLYHYSPYNNINQNTNYPAMLIITGDNDDRVPPLHSYKFAAKMQNRPVQTNPVYLLVNEQAGHNGTSGINLLSALQEKVDFYSFLVEILK